MLIGGTQIIVSDAGILPSDDGGKKRIIDPRSKMSFAFDHLTLVSTRVTRPHSEH